MNKLYILSIILLCGLSISAQNQKRNNIWKFGTHAGLDFSNGDPTLLSSAYDGNNYLSSESFSCISDTSGKLLFYTNGIFVFNRFDSVMPNGINLAADNSSSQGALIVPYPGNNNLYYIFTTDLQAGSKGFCYSIVDMSLDNGRGAVTTKNVKLLGSVAEKLCGVTAADGGYWVMTHTWLDDGFYAYKISTSGLNTTPVISHVGTVHDGILNNTNGQMKFSPDGKKIAAAIGYKGTTDLLDFDNSTGVVSKPISLVGEDISYGVEFSSNSSKLYTGNSTQSNWVVAQYDLSSNAADTILLSRKQVGLASYGEFRGFQLAPNNKIYIGKNAQDPFMGIINNPDSLGDACNFIESGLSVDSGNTGLIWAGIGLPNLIKYIPVPPLRAAFLGIDTFICNGTCVNFTDLSLNNPTSWQWRFPSASPDTSTQQNPQNICYPTPGSYPVILIVGNGGYYDTLRLNNAVKIWPVPSISVTVKGDTLTVFNSGLSWQWNRNGQPIPGATGQVYIVDSSGDYSVTTLDEHGCATTSTPIIFGGISDINENEINLYPNPSAGSWQLMLSPYWIGSNMEIYNTNGQLISRSEIKNTKAEILLDVPAGMYYLHVTSEHNSFTRKLIRL